MIVPVARRLNNTAALSTIVELTKLTIQQLDGDGIKIQTAANPITDDILTSLIVSRVESSLVTKAEIYKND